MLKISPIPVTNIYRNVLIAIIYFMLARLGFSLADVNVSVSAVWPPAGFAVAMIILYGYNIIPGLIVAAFLANYINVPDPLISSIIALGNGAAAIVSLWIWRQMIDLKLEIYEFRNIYVLIIISFVAATFSALNGTSILILTGYANHFWMIFFEWFGGDVAGILIVTPILLLKEIQWRKVFLIAGLTGIISFFVFVHSWSIGLLAILALFTVRIAPRYGFIISIFTWSSIAIFSNQQYTAQEFLPLSVEMAGLAVVTMLLVPVIRDWQYDYRPN